MNPRPWLLVPMRSFALGKRRLGASLEPGERRALNVQMLQHLLHQAAAWPGLGRTVVVSPCEEVALCVQEAGARALRQPELQDLDESSSERLNAALEWARWHLEHTSPASDLLVVSSDLPCVDAADIERLADRGRDARGSCRVVIAMDRSCTGTNALFVPHGAALKFRFGPGSARRHAEAAHAVGLASTRVLIPGLALDVDTPADLAAWHRLRKECA